MVSDGFLVGDGGEKGGVIFLILHLHHHCGCSVFWLCFFES